MVKIIYAGNVKTGNGRRARNYTVLRKKKVKKEEKKIGDWWQSPLLIPR
jgi:hypothetical protein